MMNKNSGYAGWSMSKRAVAAYDNGERPKSKWTKAAMLDAINDVLTANSIELTADQTKNLKALPKNFMFARYFDASSWHHTSKCCNATDFYSPDADAIIADADARFVPVYRIYDRHFKLVADFDRRDDAVNYLTTKNCHHAPLGDNVWFDENGESYAIKDEMR